MAIKDSRQRTVRIVPGRFFLHIYWDGVNVLGPGLKELVEGKGDGFAGAVIQVGFYFPDRFQIHLPFGGAEFPSFGLTVAGCFSVFKAISKLVGAEPLSVTLLSGAASKSSISIALRILCFSYSRLPAPIPVLIIRKCSGVLRPVPSAAAIAAPVGVTNSPGYP